MLWFHYIFADDCYCWCEYLQKFGSGTKAICSNRELTNSITVLVVEPESSNICRTVSLIGTVFSAPLTSTVPPLNSGLLFVLHLGCLLFLLLLLVGVTPTTVEVCASCSSINIFLLESSLYFDQLELTVTSTPFYRKARFWSEGYFTCWKDLLMYTFTSPAILLRMSHQ